MDYETFGEHQWVESGIFSFFDDFVHRWLSDKNHDFKTVSEAAKAPAVGEVSAPNTITWADTERDLSAWLGNSMQKESMKLLYDLKPLVYASKNGKLAEDWRRLQTSDHVYYMSTKHFNDGSVHAYFSPYKTPYDAFLYYMDALRDMRYRLQHVKISSDEIDSESMPVIKPSITIRKLPISSGSVHVGTFNKSRNLEAL